MPIKLTLYIYDNGERCETEFKGEALASFTSREQKLAFAIRAVVNPLLDAEGCNNANKIEVDLKPID